MDHLSSIYTLIHLSMKFSSNPHFTVLKLLPGLSNGSSASTKHLSNPFPPLYNICIIQSWTSCPLLWPNMSTIGQNHFRDGSNCFYPWSKSPSPYFEDVLPWLFHKGKYDRSISHLKHTLTHIYAMYSFFYQWVCNLLMINVQW